MRLWVVLLSFTLLGAPFAVDAATVTSCGALREARPPVRVPAACADDVALVTYVFVSPSANKVRIAGTDEWLHGPYSAAHNRQRVVAYGCDRADCTNGVRRQLDSTRYYVIDRLPSGSFRNLPLQPHEWAELGTVFGSYPNRAGFTIFNLEFETDANGVLVRETWSADGTDDGSTAFNVYTATTMSAFHEDGLAARFDPNAIPLPPSALLLASAFAAGALGLRRRKTPAAPASPQG